MKFPADRKRMKKLLKKNKWPPKKPNDNDADDMKKPMYKGKKKKTVNVGSVKHTGSFGGKSNALGQGGRAAQLRARGVPGGVIRNLARRAGAAPGQANYHKGSKKKTPSKAKSIKKR